MKTYPLILLSLLSFFVFSCSDNLTDLGSGIQPSSDQIKIGTDIFHVTTANVPVDFIYSKPDSFLLGSFYDPKFGSTNAEILAQVNCPEKFTFPPLSVPDSAAIVLRYTTWFGDKHSPLDVNIYEMNKSTFSYTSLYQSNIDPSTYSDQTVKLSERKFSAKDVKNTRADTTAIRFKLSNDFVKRFFDASIFANTSTFLKNFGGFYIKANFGSAALLNVSEVYLRYYYHYTYITKNISGGDSTVTVNNNLFFPANSEVRQVNCFLHPNRNTIAQPDSSVNYVASPANWNTLVSIPLSGIKKRMDAGIDNKKLTINSAMMKVEAVNIDVDTTKAPTTRYMLLVKKEALQRFFRNNELPSDTCAVLAAHTVALVAGTTNVYQDYYSFSVANMIANELKIAEQNKTALAEKLDLVLVPVQVTYNSSSSITGVKQSNLMSAVTIRSGKNPDSSMKLKVIYSGF
ncbi:MAG: DUF4270 domain-containing protein [Bacteroidota bacterium]|nr:DUF4270 domain-containing protein [Bacteroidota bacterium]